MVERGDSGRYRGGRLLKISEEFWQSCTTICVAEKAFSGVELTKGREEACSFAGYDVHMRYIWKEIDGLAGATDSPPSSRI